MQETSWQEVMSAYQSAKISAIPLTAQRRPLIKDWSRWNKELPESPLYLPNQKGVGILPGPESGIMIVDIDTEDPGLISLLKELLPTTPVQRFGSKGIGLVFSYNEKIKSRKFQTIKVEVFADSGYVVMPPSYHEKTNGYYRWIGKSLLEVGKDDLPSFDTSIIDKLERLDEEMKKTLGDLAPSPGRHNHLVGQAFSALHKGKPVDEISREIAEYDLKHHTPSYFKDEHKAKTDEDVLKAAFSFVKNVEKTFKKKNPEIVLKEDAIAEKFEVRSYPEPEGIVKHIRDLVQLTAYTSVPNMAFGSALATFSTLVGCDYNFKGVAGNIYCLLLADAGTGKKFGPDVAKKLLGRHKRVGSANYVSGAAISSSITDCVVRLDMSDEFSKVLKFVKQGGIWQQSIPQELCDLWSVSVGHYLNASAKKTDTKEPVLIERPYLSILASTTLSEFKRNVDRDLFLSGLLPRCLFFIDTAKRESKFELEDDLIENLSQQLDSVFSAWVGRHPRNNLGIPIQKVTELSLADDAKDLFKTLMNRYHLEIFDHIEGSVEQVMTGRKREQMKKLALLSSLSRSPNAMVIESIDLEWADSVLAVNTHNQQIFIKEASAENEMHSLRERVMAYIRSCPGITKRELTRRTQSLSKKQRDSIIEDLIDSERICETKASGEGSTRKPKTYHALS